MGKAGVNKIYKWYTQLLYIFKTIMINNVVAAAAAAAAAAAKSHQLCPTLCNPMDCSPPGSSEHGIL